MAASALTFVMLASLVISARTSAQETPRAQEDKTRGDTALAQLSLATLYDVIAPAQDSQSVRQVGAIPATGDKSELSIGRQKEGVTEQMMARSRAIPMTERPSALTAFLPTRNDGARMMVGDARHGRMSPRLVQWISHSGPQ